jgi:hypothetical protein
MPHASLSESYCARLLRAVAALPAGAEVDYFSTTTPKLSLRARGPSKQHRHGLLSWRFAYRYAGEQIVLTFGGYPTWTSAMAHAKARKAQVLLDEKQNPRAILYPNPAASTATLPPVDTGKMMFERYDDAVLSSKSNAHRANTIGYFRRHILPLCGERGVKEVTRREIVDLIDGVARTRGPITANRLSAAISAWLNFLVGDGILDVSPAGRLRKSEEKPRERCLSEAELVTVWQAADQLGGPHGRFIKLLIATLARRDEAAGLPFREIGEHEISDDGAMEQN